jgi:ATP phosphoribosyltransferase regulatory subunit
MRLRERSLLPKGMAAFLPEAASRMRWVEERLLSVFFGWGFQEVVPPVFEYLDMISAGLGEGLVEKGYTVVDRGSGRLMLLRPDVTPQIAKMVATQMRDYPSPFRLCYRANVFRHEEEHAGLARELFQVGGELIGDGTATADAEMIAIGIEALESVGIRNFRAVLGQVEVFRRILAPLPADQRTAVREAVTRKDRSQLARLVRQGLPGYLVEWPTLFGDRKILDRAERIGLGGPALDRLREVHDLLCGIGYEKRILLDLSEVRGFDYYTGVVFELFSEGVGYPLARGGRYDHLVGRFGLDRPATGFGFDVERVQRAAHFENSPARPPQTRKRASALLRRARGVGAVEDRLGAATSRPHRPPQMMIVLATDGNRDSFRLARELRREGVRVVLRTDGTETSEALRFAATVKADGLVFLSGTVAAMVQPKTGRTRRFPVGRLVTEIRRLAR